MPVRPEPRLFRNGVRKAAVLTPMEQAVLDAYAQGMSRTETAVLLGLKPDTVGRYYTIAREKQDDAQ